MNKSRINKLTCKNTMDNNYQAFQGDVSIIKIEKLGKRLDFKPLKNGFVVAEGEVSGHHHRLVAERDSVVEIAWDENGFYLNVKSGSVKLNHEEHATQTIERGLWFLGRQIEYDEISERKVMD